MTPERFESLAQAYGGDIARWPAAERDAAALRMAADQAWAERILAEAGAVDAWLAAAPAPLPSATLADRIVAAAPRPRRRGLPGLGWMVPAGLAAGLAAACAAGVVIGARLAPEPHPASATAQAAAIAEEDSVAILEADV